MAKDTASALRSATSGASWNVALQIFFRLFTFALNAAVLRYVAPSVLGLANVRLMLLHSTVLFLSREPLRKACLGDCGDDNSDVNTRPKGKAAADGSARAGAGAEGGADESSSCSASGSGAGLGSGPGLVSDSVSHSASIRHQQLVNLSWAPIPLGFVCGLTLGTLWLRLDADTGATDGSGDYDYYPAAVFAYSIAAWVELWSEPLYVVAQRALLVHVRVAAEGVAVVARGVVLLSALHLQAALRQTDGAMVVAAVPTSASTLGGMLDPLRRFASTPLGAFSLAQLTYSLAVCGMYAFQLLRRPVQGQEQGRFVGLDSSCTTPHDLLPRDPSSRVPHSSGGGGGGGGDKSVTFVDARRLALALSFFKQSILKQLLTEGERFAMTFLPLISLAEQGVYDVVNNLGSLVARFVFMPIEEAFFLFFAHVVDRHKVRLRLWGRTFDDSDECTRAGAQQIRVDTSAVKEAALTLSTLLKLVALLGLLVASFGQGYSWTLLHLYGGTTLSAAPGPSLLRCYCLYVFFMALNGVSECFVTAVAPPRYVDFFNWLMGLFSATFLCALFVLVSRTHGLGLGPIGLIAANLINMAVRVVHHVFFIRAFFRWQTDATSAAEATSARAGIGGGIGRGKLLAEAVPSGAVLMSLTASCLVVSVLERLLLGDVENRPHDPPRVLNIVAHVGVGVVLLVLVAVALWRTESVFLMRLRRLRRGGGADDEHEKRKQE